MNKVLFLILSLLVSAAAAHAVVRTDTGGTESLAGRYETYRLQVPVEKPLATTEVRLLIPDGVKVGTFLPVPGFERTVEYDAQGNITAVTWRGQILPEEFQRFLFSARNPAEAATLSWKVYQTSADGSVTAWDDQDPATPASRTTVKAGEGQ